ncbi:MAG: CBS domain-containing protein [Acetobacteraceae bacterium]|nr:CBS domain-containing protein [Acetobacteraceae bacterium]
MTVAAILRHKGSAVASARPDQTVADIAQQLATRRIGALPVLENGVLIGIISERDIVHALANHAAAALNMPARAFMTTQLSTATRATTVGEAMQIMTNDRFRHLPVLENGALIGIVSIGDVVKARITQQETEVDSLKAYVAGSV